VTGGIELDQRHIASDTPFVTVDGERIPLAPHRHPSGSFDLVVVERRPVEALFDTGLNGYDPPPATSPRGARPRQRRRGTRKRRTGG
jgi:hypothetical protein